MIKDGGADKGPMRRDKENRNMSLAGGEELCRCEHPSLEPSLGNCLLNYQCGCSHNSPPCWYLQSFQEEDEKVIALLQHSVNTTGNVRANYGHTLSSKKVHL